MNKTILVAIALISLLFVSCGESDSKKTKLDLCLSLVNSYCSHSDKMGCDYPECKTEQGDYCKDTFDGSCEASADEILAFEDEIPTMWIETKETCAALESIESAVDIVVTDMAQSPCTGVSDNSDNDDSDDSSTKTVGKLCDDILDATCQKLIDLSCIDGSNDINSCKTDIYNSNIATLGTHTCTSSNDSTEADADMIADYEAALAELNNLNSCADFGF